MADKVKPEDLTLHPTTRSARYISLSGYDWWYVAIVGCSLYFGSDLLPGAISGWVVVLGGVGFLLSLMRVSKYNKRAYRLPEYFVKNYMRRKFQHYRRWTQSPNNKVPASEEEPASSSKSTKKRSAPGQSDLPIRVVRFGDIGTVVNEKYRMITFIVRISGTDITTKTIEEQKTFNERLGEALKFSVSAVRKSNPWIGMVYRSRPDNEYEYERMLRGIVDDRVLLPHAEEKPIEEWDEDDYINSFLHQVVVQEGMEEIQSLVNPEMVFTFTVRYSDRFAKVLASAQKGGHKSVVNFDHKHLMKEPVMKLRDAVIPLIADVFTGDVKVLDFDETIMYLRMAHDLNISKYYLDAYLAENIGESLPSTSWMPEGYIDEFADKVDVNGSWHATIYATSFPDEFAYPFTAREFYTPRTTHFTATTIGKITKGDHRYRGVQAANDMSDGAKDFFGIDTTRGPKAHKQQQQVYNQLAQLDRSGWAATFQPMLTVSKTSEYDLEVAVQHVDSRLDGSLFGPQRVIGESVQWEQFFVASTGIPLQF